MIRHMRLPLKQLSFFSRLAVTFYLQRMIRVSAPRKVWRGTVCVVSKWTRLSRVRRVGGCHLQGGRKRCISLNKFCEAME